MTLNDLYRKTLEEMTVVAAGEPADAGDLALIASKYLSVYEQLRGLKLVTWSNTEDVPTYVVEPLAWMLSFAASQNFGKKPDALKGAIGLPSPSLAERMLRQQLARDYISSPAQSEYF